METAVETVPDPLQGGIHEIHKNTSSGDRGDHR